MIDFDIKQKKTTATITLTTAITRILFILLKDLYTHVIDLDVKQKMMIAKTTLILFVLLNDLYIHVIDLDVKGK